MNDRLEFEITVNESIKKASELIKKMVADSEAVKSNLSMAKGNENIAKQVKDIKNRSKFIEKEKKSVSSLMAAKNQLTKLEKQEIQLKGKLSVAATDQNKKNTRLKVSLQEYNKRLKRSVQIERSKEGSINQLNLKLKKNIDRYRSLSKAQRENSKEGKALLKTITRQQKEMKNTDVSTSKFGKSLSGVKNILSGFGIGIGISFIANLGKELFNTAIRLEQVERKAKIVFGQSFPRIAIEAENLSKKLGLTNSEFVKAATNTADLLVPLNFTRERAADLSLDLTKLSGALNEWSGNTLGAEEVSNILTKALLGEAEQIKQLGIVIDQSSKEYNKRIKLLQETEGLTKEQARALDILNQIQTKSIDAQNAFADSSDNLLRRQTSLSRFWRNLKEGAAGFVQEIGTEFNLLGQKIDLFFNAIKAGSNKLFKTSFDVAPIETFRESLFRTNRVVKNLSEEVDRFGLETEQGQKAADQLKAALENTFSQEEAKALFDDFIKEQERLADARVKIAEAEAAEQKRIQKEQTASLRKEQAERAREQADQRFNNALKLLQEKQKIEMINAQIAEQGEAEIFQIRQRQFEETLKLYKQFGKGQESQSKQIQLNQLNSQKEFTKAFQEENQRLLQSIEKQEYESFNEKKLLDKSAFDLKIRQMVANNATEKQLALEKKRFEIKQQIELLDFLRLNGEDRNATQIKLTQDLISGLEIELAELKNIPKPKLQEILGLTDQEFEATKNAAKNFVSQLGGFLNQIASTQLQVAEAQIQQSNDIIRDLENDLEQQRENIRSGRAGDTAFIEQQIAKEKQVRKQAQADRRKAIQTQNALDTASQVSSIITAIANVIKGWSTVPLIGSILGIAAAGVMVAAFTKLKLDQRKNIKKLEKGGKGIIGGGSHASGNDTYIPEFNAKAEKGERWDIWSKANTNKYNDVLDAMHKGKDVQVVDSLTPYGLTGLVVPDNILELKKHGELLSESIKIQEKIRDKPSIASHEKGFIKYDQKGNIHIVKI